jgi:hypothetical protein
MRPRKKSKIVTVDEFYPPLAYSSSEDNMSEYKHRVATKKMVASYLQSDAGVSTDSFRDVSDSYGINLKWIVSTLKMEATDF